MLCRIKHTGLDPRYLSISDFTLAPGFTSPDIDLVEGSPDALVVDEWVQEGLVVIMPPSSNKRVSVDAGGRSTSHVMTAEEVRENMSPSNKRRRKHAMTRNERTMATHRAPVGMPFGPGRNARMLTAEDLAQGKPEPLPPPPVPNDRTADIGKEGASSFVESGTEGSAIGGADRSQAQGAPMNVPEKGTLSAEDLRKRNKAPVDEIVEEEKEDPEEAATEEEIAEEEMGEQPPDNLMLEVIDGFVEVLGEMTKAKINMLAEQEKVELSSSTLNKAPLIAEVAKGLADKGYTELPKIEE